MLSTFFMFHISWVIIGVNPHSLTYTPVKPLFDIVRYNHEGKLHHKLQLTSNIPPHLWFSNLRAGFPNLIMSLWEIIWLLITLHCVNNGKRSSIIFREPESSTFIRQIFLIVLFKRASIKRQTVINHTFLVALNDLRSIISSLTFHASFNFKPEMLKKQSWREEKKSYF